MAENVVHADEQDLEKGEVETIESYDETKRKLDDIQHDIDTLMENLNVFLSNSLDSSDDDVSEDGSTEEKNYKDKCFINANATFEWENIKPVIENIMGDLDQLQVLNKETNNVVTRINEIAQSKDVDFDKK